MYNTVVQLCQLFLFGGKANLVLLTLFYSTLLALSGKPLQNDGRTDNETNKLASRGLEELYFQFLLLCQFTVLVGIRFWLYILLMNLGYRTMQLWCCVSFVGSGRK